MSETKVCTKCGREHPATTEYFYHNERCKYGVEAQCKECRNKRMKLRNKGYLVGKKGYREGNKYECLDDVAIGYTKKGERFLISKESLQIAQQYTWSLDQEGYVNCSIMIEKGKYVHQKLHRVVMGLELGDGRIVDHINRDKTDNRIQNLRIVTTQENSFNQSKSSKNKSGVVGVFYRERIGKNPHWIASININKKTIQLGQFKAKEEAVKARREAELKYYNGMRYNREGE